MFSKISNKSIKIIQPIFYLYIILLINNSQLIPSSVRKEIETNKLIQHFTIFISLVLLLYVFYEKLNTSNLLFYGLICYISFLLLTKLDKNFTYLLMGALALFILYERDSKLKLDESKNDDVLTHKEHKKIIQKISNRRSAILTSILIACAMGLVYTSVNSDHNKQLYGGGVKSDMDVLAYLFG